MTQKTENATFVSVWDGGIEIKSICTTNSTRTKIIDIQSPEPRFQDDDHGDLEHLDEEYVEFADGTQITAVNEDDYAEFTQAHPETPVIYYEY